MPYKYNLSIEHEKLCRSLIIVQMYFVELALSTNKIPLNEGRFVYRLLLYCNSIHISVLFSIRAKAY